MEDQQADSGDLTPDASNPPVPQSKSTRRRHRLPRGQVKPEAAEPSPGPTAVEQVEEPAAESEVTAVPVDDAAGETEVVEPEPEAVELEPAEAVEPETAESEPEPQPEGSGEAIEPEPAPPAEPEPAPPAEPEPAPRDEETTEPAAETDAATGDTETDAAVVDAAAAVADAADEPAAEPTLVPHRPAGRLLKAAAVVAAVLFVAAAAFAGASAQQYLSDRAEAHVKFDIAKTAADAITTLFTYTPDDLEQLPRRSAQYLSGDFAADYKRYIDSIVAPNKQAQVSNQTQVLGAAVESLTGKEATALVYTNSVSTTPVKKGLPSLQYRSYRLDMQRDARRWFVTRMVPITTLDLTPRV